MAEGIDADSGSARTAEVLGPSFGEGLGGLPLDEVRRRRDRALAEREFQSYLRRLVQTRQDILTAERERRRRGAEPQPVVERLKAVLSEGPQGRGRGEAIRLSISDQDTAQAERRADALVASSVVAGAERLSEEELKGAIEALDRAERAISSDRTAVLRVHDRLQEELKHRYQRDPSLIPTEL